MNRRDYLKLKFGALAFTSLPAVSSFALDQYSWKAQFHRALKDKPWLLGYKGAESLSYESKAKKISGELPDELRGTHYRNGPARHEIGDFRYHHWFDGDGMLNAFQFSDAGVSHKARMIQTQKHKAELAANRALYPGFATIPPDPKPVTSPDSINSANISVLAHHNKLLALWEAGSAHEINPETLETVGTYAFTEDTAGAPFSAHPRIEPDGTLWNFGYMEAANLLIIWHIDVKGKLVKAEPIKVDPITMIHDFVVTAKHLVFLVPPLHFNKEARTNFLDSHEWHASDPTRVLVVDKNDFSNQSIHELPAQWVYHFGNAWEDEAGVIRFDAARSPNAEFIFTTFRDVMRGITPNAGESHHYTYRIDTKNGKISESQIVPDNIGGDFPSIDPRVSTHRYKQVFLLTANNKRPAPHGWLTSVSRLNVESGNMDTYEYPINQIPEEHLFVPKAGSATEGEGWVIGTSLDYLEAKTIMSVFNAQNLNAGPIAEYQLPYALPLGLHGKFVR